MIQTPDKYPNIPVFTLLESEKQRLVAYEAYLALYVVASTANGTKPPEEALQARTIDDILENEKNEDLLTSDRNPDTFGGVTILAALRAVIESQIKQAKAEVQNASVIALRKKTYARQLEKSRLTPRKKRSRHAPETR